MKDQLPIGERIVSDRLYYRRILPDDCTEQYWSWLVDRRVNEYLETRYYKPSIEEMRDFAALHAFDPTYYLLGIFIRSGNLHIGNIKLSHINFTHRFSENISYFIGPKDRQGKGYATEAVTRVSEWGFDKLKLLRIEAGAHRSHRATIRVLEKSGYHLESTCVRKMKHAGAQEDQLIYVRFAEEAQDE